MAKVLINDSFQINAEFSFDVEYDQRSNPPIRSITGVLMSSDGYLGEINKIENDRYALDDVYVYKESYGSDEDVMMYYFTAKVFGMDNRLQEVKAYNG